MTKKGRPPAVIPASKIRAVAGGSHLRFDGRLCHFDCIKKGSAREAAVLQQRVNPSPEIGVESALSVEKSPALLGRPVQRVGEDRLEPALPI
jgi:hypothetical protein